MQMYTEPTPEMKKDDRKFYRFLAGCAGVFIALVLVIVLIATC